MKLTILGTGNAMVTECYNTCFVCSDGTEHFLIDGGGGSTLLTQLKRAEIPWRDIRTVFITHKHIDHLLGIIWIMRLVTQKMSEGDYEGEVTVYGHSEVLELLRELCEKLLQKKTLRFLDTRVHLIPVEDGECCEVLGREVTFFDIHSTKAKQFGFSIKLRNGKRFTCCGDEPYNESEEIYAKGSAWLLHEAFCLYGQADRFHPYEKHHSTVKDACELAQQLGVENLLLYHTEDANIERRRELYTAEGKEYYSGNLYVPEDLDVIMVEE